MSFDCKIALAIESRTFGHSKQFLIDGRRKIVILYDTHTNSCLSSRRVVTKFLRATSGVPTNMLVSV